MLPEVGPHLVRAIIENGRLCGRSWALPMFWVLACTIFPIIVILLRRPSQRKCLCVIGLDAEFGCSSGEFELGADVEFRVSVAQVCFDGAFAEKQVPGDVRR